MFMGRRLSLVLLLSICAMSFASEKPKLVVAISLDQFRYDYLVRFEEYFGERGFNLFLKQGANFVNAHYVHSQTSTGPGHAVIMSGTHGCINGIIANGWYDAVNSKSIYCVGDDRFPIIGGFAARGRSPKNFIGSTVGDHLRESNNGRSKVISISRKDRAAILMGGKLATAYWIVDSTYTTSTYYMEELPEWVTAFNRLNKISAVRGKIWERALSEEVYTLTQGPDDVPTEQMNYGADRVFPHPIGGDNSGISRREFHKAFEKSPFESEVLVEFAKQAVIEEELGQREMTDILCLSFAATDAVGHTFGPHSHEIMDMVIRTDRILADLFNFLDEKIGLANCTVVLTADHGVMPLPEVLAAHNPNFEIRRVNDDDIEAVAEQILIERYGIPVTNHETMARENVDLREQRKHNNYVILAGKRNIYFNLPLFREQGIAIQDAEFEVKRALERIPEMYAVYTRTELMAGQVMSKPGRQALESFHPLRSGHLFFQLEPFVSSKKKDGTGHGSPWGYDSHVPLLWYSPTINPGTYYQAVSVADIAPTLSVLLETEFPAGMQGRVLHEILR